MVEDLSRKEQLEEFALRVGIDIHNLDLLDQALTHASIASELPVVRYNYESLEFLGDAALGLATAHYLFEHAPGRTPGEYSRIRAAVVNRRTLARVAAKLNIAPVIRLGKGEELSGGRQRAALLADCVEALIGAIYMDQGWSAAHGFVIRVFADELDKAQSLETVWDYKSRLQHYCQAVHGPLPQFKVVSSEGPDHQKRFEIEVILDNEPAGRGEGSTKKEAEQNAARAALRQRNVEV